MQNLFSFQTSNTSLLDKVIVGIHKVVDEEKNSRHHLKAVKFLLTVTLQEKLLQEQDLEKHIKVHILI